MLANGNEEKRVEDEAENHFWEQTNQIQRI